MRGALLFVFLAEVHRLDRRGNPPNATIRMDEDFREPVRLDGDSDGIGEELRRELPPVLVPCQVEPNKFEERRQFPSGNSPRSTLELVMHFRDLERLGLVGEDGNSLIGVGDRLAGMHSRAGRLEWTVRNPPGLFVTEAQPSGFGLGGRRNLLLVTFTERALGAL